MPKVESNNSLQTRSTVINDRYMSKRKRRTRKYKKKKDPEKYVANKDLKINNLTSPIKENNLREYWMKFKGDYIEKANKVPVETNSQHYENKSSIHISEQCKENYTENFEQLYPEDLSLPKSKPTISDSFKRFKHGSKRFLGIKDKRNKLTSNPDCLQSNVNEVIKYDIDQPDFPLPVEENLSTNPDIDTVVKQSDILKTLLKEVIFKDEYLDSEQLLNTKENNLEIKSFDTKFEERKNENSSINPKKRIVVPDKTINSTINENRFSHSQDLNKLIEVEFNSLYKEAVSKSDKNFDIGETKSNVNEICIIAHSDDQYVYKPPTFNRVLETHFDSNYAETIYEDKSCSHVFDTNHNIAKNTLNFPNQIDENQSLNNSNNDLICMYESADIKQFCNKNDQKSLYSDNDSLILDRSTGYPDKMYYPLLVDEPLSRDQNDDELQSQESNTLNYEFANSYTLNDSKDSSNSSITEYHINGPGTELSSSPSVNEYSQFECSPNLLKFKKPLDPNYVYNRLNEKVYSDYNIPYNGTNNLAISNSDSGELNSYKNKENGDVASCLSDQLQIISRKVLPIASPKPLLPERFTLFGSPIHRSISHLPYESSSVDKQDKDLFIDGYSFGLDNYSSNIIKCKILKDASKNVNSAVIKERTRRQNNNHSRRSKMGYDTLHTRSIKDLQTITEDPIGIGPDYVKSEHLFKILVIGNLSTGKTSIIKRYVHQFFSDHYRATVGVDFALKVLNWDSNTTVRLQLWDIAGQERYAGGMTRVYYKEAVGAFVVFDVTDTTTLDAALRWKKDLDDKITQPDGGPIPSVLLANKCDKSKESNMKSIGKMDLLCKEAGFSTWFETSAKNNINIEKSVNYLVHKILKSVKDFNGSTESYDTDKINVAEKTVNNSEMKKSCPC